MTEERDNRLDEALSALRDGELSPSEERGLRTRIESDPALRGRLEAFEAVDGALGNLASREVPSDLARRLRERIERESVGSGGRARRAPERGTPARRRSGAWGALGVGLAAAAVALYLAVPSPPGPETGPAGSEVAEVGDTPADFVPAEPRVAEAPQPRAEPDVLLDASEEEVAIALHYETLADLEMIEELEMLELLAALDEAGPHG